jgi:hypothetical protein
MRRWNECRALSGREKRFLFAAFIVQSLIIPALRIWGFRRVHAFLHRTAPTPHFPPSTQAAKDVLVQFEGKQLTATIVEEVMAEHRTLFPARKLADRFVKDLVERYSL